jgi:hypothetical protein
MANYKILILGASYSSLLASKILLGGHSVKLVCLPDEADLIKGGSCSDPGPRTNRGYRARFSQAARPSAAGAAGVDPKEYDLIGLAMQEPQFGSPGVRELMNAVARSRVPCMSIMNMPPLPYMRRILNRLPTNSNLLTPHPKSGKKSTR